MLLEQRCMRTCQITELRFLLSTKEFGENSVLRKIARGIVLPLMGRDRQVASLLPER